MRKIIVPGAGLAAGGAIAIELARQHDVTACNINQEALEKVALGVQSSFIIN